MEDIKMEDRQRQYSFNIDGKWVTVAASDREIVEALKLYKGDK
jgi:myo-inositol-hexaphosphate 3-phosphohydrolase